MLVGTHGIRLDVRREGEGDPVVFLHTAGHDRTQWEPQVAHLRDRYECITLDQRNHGRSDTTYGPLILPILARDVMGVVDAFGLASVHLVGAALGATVACRVAVDFPDRVRTVTLLSTFLREADMAWAAPLRDPGADRAAKASVQRRQFAARTWEERPELPREVAALRASRDPLLGHAYPGVLRQSLEPMWDELPTIAAPVLSLHGEEDALASPVAVGERLREQVGNVSVVAVPEAAHYPNLENPTFVNEQLVAHLQGPASDQVGGAPA